MKNLGGILALAVLSASCVQAGSESPAPPLAPPSLVVDHRSVEVFDSLTPADRTRVRGLKVFFQHASVGGNILDGLRTLAGAPGTAYDLGFSTPTTDRTALEAWLTSNTGIADDPEGNPGWAVKVSDFGAHFEGSGLGDLVDVAMMKFCWIDPDADFATYRDALTALEARFPRVRFVWWTMPITTAETDNTRGAFNALVREYTRAHGKVLFDLADIESHDPAGDPVLTGGFEAQYPGYSSDGGHLNAAGQERTAQALWVLLSRISRP